MKYSTADLIFAAVIVGVLACLGLAIGLSNAGAQVGTVAEWFGAIATTATVIVALYLPHYERTIRLKEQEAEKYERTVALIGRVHRGIVEIGDTLEQLQKEFEAPKIFYAGRSADDMSIHMEPALEFIHRTNWERVYEYSLLPYVNLQRAILDYNAAVHQPIVQKAEVLLLLAQVRFWLQEIEAEQ